MKITVFTPTFNRAYVIEKLYESLKQQSFKDFEWLVIDDGSTDDTNELFTKWIGEQQVFPIRYYRVVNGGKHRAINKATDLAQGEFFFIVDSDDHLKDNTLELIDKWTQSLPRNERFCGVSGNKGKSTNELIGTTFESAFIDATSLERHKYNITGDKAEVFFTDIIQKYKFKEFEDENFLTEATVWNRIANDGYKIRWFNEVIYICDYLEDGLTQNISDAFGKNPKGTAYYFKQQMKLMNFNIKGRLSYYNLYYQYVKKRIGLKEAASYLEIKLITLLVAVFLWGVKDLFFTKSN